MNNDASKLQDKTGRHEKVVRHVTARLNAVGKLTRGMKGVGSQDQEAMSNQEAPVNGFIVRDDLFAS